MTTKQESVQGAAKLMYAIELRDLFAGMAMVAEILRHPSPYHEVAECAYKQADAMLEARKEKP